MLVTLKAIVEEFDPAQVECNGWVIKFRDLSKDETRRFGKSSGEITKVVDSSKRDRRKRLCAWKPSRKMDLKVRKGWQNIKCE